MAHAKFDAIRHGYGCRCGYCTISEAEAGGELAVDHYRPVSAGGDDSESNLVYACFRCNLYKGDFWPDQNDLEHCRRVLHPLLDAVDLHVRENHANGQLEALTETGRFHIALLHLNRPALVARRIQRRIASLLIEKQRLLEQENAQLRATIQSQERYITRLRRHLD